MNRHVFHKNLNTVLIYAFLIIIGFTTIFPLLWMLATSLKDPYADVSKLTSIVPSKCHWDNYRAVFVETNFLREFCNSVFVTFTITAGKVFTSSIAAYAFARMIFWGRNHIFLGYIATMMIPHSVTMIPTFLLLQKLGWIDTYYALILPEMFTAYGTFMLRQFFLNLPRDLEEAAMIDGCNSWQIYCNVIIPLSRNALITLAILIFMGSWKNFMWPLIVIHSAELYTLPVALAKFKEMYGIQWPLLMAGSVIMILPMFIVFIAGQRFFIKGITLGAVKG
ncbi:MAG: Sugar ABC transporter, permease protein [Candidatus Uhrbacteria bacterium GW2011_GWF2_39_13]|uniref:Sugar ABC transporter, permease protein n=1 Tax=Candidatus Uhrbacteria bacterium GW2011_GWF2_39_13 TaxID=1618995 RepID=A0A0G0MVC0_9BACT|nr:MAG: Sugar ABC transporter, permease protein [Candidatus Uhrbacteria bacterium GW2011_GWF2_39_13]